LKDLNNIWKCNITFLQGITTTHYQDLSKVNKVIAKSKGGYLSVPTQCIMMTGQHLIQLQQI